MKAVRLNAPGQLEYCDVPIPVPGEDEVLCRVEAVSICGTDPHIIDGDFPGFWPPGFPLIPGHEWAGQIVELGKRAELYGWKAGERVAGMANVGCGYCKNCLEGRYTICLNYGKPRIHSMYGHITQGAYAEYIKVSIKSIYRIPDVMSWQVGACMDPLSIALHMVLRSGLKPGDRVLVNGSGAQGLMAVICGVSMGAGQVIVTGSGSRLQAAERLGGIPVDYRREDALARIMELTEGYGADRVLECTGSPEGAALACQAAARGGTVSAVSLPNGDVPIPVRRLVLDEITFAGCRANPNTMEPAIAIAGQNLEKIARLITHEFAMSDYEKAFDVFRGRKENAVKVIMRPGA